MNNTNSDFVLCSVHVLTTIEREYFKLSHFIQLIECTYTVLLHVSFEYLHGLCREYKFSLSDHAIKILQFSYIETAE